jgi:putative oxidoreductase
VTEFATREPRPLIPALKSFYAAVRPLSWLIIRLTAGLMLIPHGWPKVQAGVAATAASALAKRGIEPAEPLAVVIMTLETVGALCIALGLFTRFWAVAVAIEMTVIAYQYISAGFGWTRPGYEYPLMWGLIMLAIALRGGGPWSLDRKVGWEL